MLESSKMERFYYIVIVIISFLHVTSSHQNSNHGTEYEASSAEVYIAARGHDDKWAFEQDVGKEMSLQTDNGNHDGDQFHDDSVNLVNKLESEGKQTDQNLANEGLFGQEIDQSDVEMQEDEDAGTKNNGRIPVNENDDIEMEENKLNIEQESYENGGNAGVEEGVRGIQIEENEEAEMKIQNNIEEVEDEAKDGMAGKENDRMENYQDDTDAAEDTVYIDNKDFSAEDKDILKIENGNDDTEHNSGVENYFDNGVSELDGAVTSEWQSEKLGILVQQEGNSKGYQQMVKDDQNTLKSKRRNIEENMNKQKRKKDKQRRNKQGGRRRRNKYELTKNQKKQRRKRNSRRSKDKDKRHTDKYDSILDGFNKLQSLPKRLICSEVKKKLQRLSNSGSISYNSPNIINFKVNSQSSVKLSSFIPINGYNRLKIKSVLFDCSNYALTIKTKPTNKWRIVPNVLSVTRVTMILSVTLSTPQQTFKVDMKGVWQVGSFTVPITINYNHAKRLTRVEAEAHQGASLTGLVGSITGLALPLPIPSRISFTIQGEVSGKGAINLLISSLDGRNRYYAGYSKINTNAIPVKTIAVDVRRFRLSNLLRRLLKFDISHTPYFGKIPIPEIGAIYSTGKMTIDSTKVFRNSPLLQGTKNVINKGFTAFMRVSFHHEPLIVTYKNKVLLITTPHRNLRLDKLIQAIMPGRARSQTSIPFLLLNEMTKLYIEEVKVTRGSVCAAVSYPKQLSFFQNIIELSSIKANVCVRNSKPMLSANLNGRIRIGGVTFKTKLAQNEHGKYFLSAMGDGKLSFNNLLQTFQASLLPRKLSRFLRNIPFLRFSIYNPRISYVFGIKPLQLHIGGLPSIHGFRIVNMDIIVLKKNRKLQAISGFEMGKVNLAVLLSRITNYNFKRFLILDQSISLSITVSSVTLSKVHFAIGKLSSLPIKKGISVKASLTFPRNCKSDNFCKLVGRLINYNAKLSLSTTIQSATYYYIAASLDLDSLDLGRGISLRKAGIEIIGGASLRIGLVGKVKLHQPNLVFAGRIYVGKKGLALQLSMKNCWHKAFGAEWLDICNLLGAIDFAPPTGITGLVLGGQIHLGYRSTGRQLQAKAYISISMIDPTENYYFANFSTTVTMHSLLRAFRINWKVPRPLGNSGFPNGFMSSFSFLGKELPEVDLSIPRGLRIKGTLNILGLQSHADITIDLPRLLDINVALPPIKIGGIFSMYASSRDRKRGPYLKAKLSLYQRRVNIEAKGYLRVLGVSFSTELKITNSHYSFSFRQKLFDLFWARVCMRANYGSIQSAHFYIHGSFEGDLFIGIQNIAKRLLQEFSNAANKALNGAKRAFHKFQDLKRTAQDNLNKLYSKLKFWRKKVLVSRIHHDSFEYRNKKAHTNFIEGTYNAVIAEINTAETELKQHSHSLQMATLHLNNVKVHFKKGLHMFNYIRRHGLGGIISVRKVTFSGSLGASSTGQFSCEISVEFLKKMRHIRTSINLRKLNEIGMELFHLAEKLF